MSKAILVNCATGNQGGALINALLASKHSHLYKILAVTRNAQSGSAKTLAAKSPSIKLVQANQDDAPSLFKSAKQAADGQPIWGVFSVQVASIQGGGATDEGEVAQGTAMVDEAVKHGVQHFVYSSVDRGGDEASWTRPTQVPHFQTKHRIEHHLRDHAGAMAWTILRPTAFMDNLTPGFQPRVFMAGLQRSLGPEKRLQWVAASDIGCFAAMAFEDSKGWNGKALGLAGDELSVDELLEVFRSQSLKPPTPTFSIIARGLLMALTDLRLMVEWFGSDGYGADLKKLRQMRPDTKNMAEWLEKESKFVKAS